MSEQEKNLRWYNLAMMAFVSVWGFGNVVNNFANQGLTVVVSWVLIIGLYFVPYALMVGELGSVFKDSKGGVSSWIRGTFGTTLAYFAGWTYWVVHIPYLAQKPQAALIALGWTVKQDGNFIKDMNPMTAQLLTLAVFLLFLWIASRGITSLKVIGTIAGTSVFVMSLLYVVLMLAAPVSFEGRLEQYVGRLNRDYVGKEAVYVYDYIDSHVRYFDKMYAKRLRTYRKMGFSIWTQELQPKQIINAIFDSVNYTEKFEQDIVESEKMLVISSPDIRQDKIDRFLLLIKKRQEVGVKVTVITTDPEDITYGKSDVCYELIRAMQLVGINVITRTEVEECFAVIDDEIVWHGGMNLLGKADVWDNLMRIRNSQVATELLEIALGCSEERRKSE